MCPLVPLPQDPPQLVDPVWPREELLQAQLFSHSLGESGDSRVTMAKGVSVPFTLFFDKPGTYQLVCIPHETNGMLGTIRVQ